MPCSRAHLHSRRRKKASFRYLLNNRNKQNPQCVFSVLMMTSCDALTLPVDPPICTCSVAVRWWVIWCLESWIYVKMFHEDGGLFTLSLMLLNSLLSGKKDKKCVNEIFPPQICWGRIKTNTSSFVRCKTAFFSAELCDFLITCIHLPPFAVPAKLCEQAGTIWSLNQHLLGE